MTTHRAIVDALYASANGGEPVVLATVVRITGSSYGGVVAEHAREVNASRHPRVVSYDTRADDETAWGLGLGCNGLIDVLLEPLTPIEAGAIGRLIEQGLISNAPVVIATVVAVAGGLAGAPRIGAHALFSGETIETTGDWGDRLALQRAHGESSAALDAGRRGMIGDYNGVQVAFEVIVPAVRLVICGGGPDVVPLVRMGAQLGWNVTVVDHRAVTPEHSNRLRDARVVECAVSSQLGDCVSLDPRTAVVVMSHHYARDLDYVRVLLASDAAYIGVLGPRARSEKMLAELGGVSDERLFAPVGLDLGGDGPEAIGLAIVAEISSAMSRRSGGHLRDRREPLH
jgi:xanthine/CO dehydrogenase XdhC/CoxF family maturation factor